MNEVITTPWGTEIKCLQSVMDNILERVYIERKEGKLIRAESRYGVARFDNTERMYQYIGYGSSADEFMYYDQETINNMYDTNWMIHVANMRDRFQTGEFIKIYRDDWFRAKSIYLDSPLGLTKLRYHYNNKNQLRTVSIEKDGKDLIRYITWFYHPDGSLKEVISRKRDSYRNQLKINHRVKYDNGKICMRETVVV